MTIHYYIIFSRHLYCCDVPRRSKVRFAPTSFYAYGKKDVIRPLPCSSFPNRTRCAGLRFGLGYKLGSSGIYTVAMSKKRGTLWGAFSVGIPSTQMNRYECYRANKSSGPPEKRSFFGVICLGGNGGMHMIYSVWRVNGIYRDKRKDLTAWKKK